LIVVLQGPDAFLRSEYANALRLKLAEQHGEVDVIRFDGQSASAADVLDECRSFGLMQQHKIVLVDQAEQLIKESNRPLMERYAAAPSEQATLVLRSGDKWHPGNFDKMVDKVGEVVRCEAFLPVEIARWMTERAKRVHKVGIEADAMRALVVRMNSELGRIDSEIAKLATMLAGGTDKPTIRIEHVLEQSGKVGLDDPWMIQAPLLSGDPDLVLHILSRLLDDNAKDLVVPISWSMMDLAGKLHAACALMAAGEYPGSISSRLKIWPREKADGVMALARRTTPEQTLALYQQCVQGDRAMKTGLGKPEDRVQRQAIAFTRLGKTAH
jgi:DNA polymerase III delta subunit